jgi:hypothetical protein
VGGGGSGRLLRWKSGSLKKRIGELEVKTGLAG